MDMISRIGFSVAYASSYEDKYSYKELERRDADVGNRNNTNANKNNDTSQLRGWQSARNCEYPQRLILQLDEVCEMKQIQILSHQSKIASKIEIWIANHNGNTNDNNNQN